LPQFFHVSADVVTPGTVLRGSFRLLEAEKVLFEAVASAASRPGDLSELMLRHMRSVVTNPGLRGQFDSTIIEGIAEYVRQRDYGTIASRALCSFGFLSANDARDFVHRFRPQAPPHFIYLVEPLGRAWLADVAIFDRGFDYSIPFKDAVRELIGVGTNYWKSASLDLTIAGKYHRPEILMEGGARVVAALGPV
jgi:hypothetical protein